MFVEITENDFVPAFMIIEGNEEKQPISSLYAPDRDFNDIDNPFESKPWLFKDQINNCMIF